MDIEGDRHSALSRRHECRIPLAIAARRVGVDAETRLAKRFGRQYQLITNDDRLDRSLKTYLKEVSRYTRGARQRVLADSAMKKLAAGHFENESDPPPPSMTSSGSIRGEKS
jgi:hypothetical protein